MTAIEISEPLSQSKFGFTTMHNIFLDGKRMGYVEVGFIQKDKIKIFQKYTKQKLFIGQPFRTQIFIDVKENGLTPDKLGVNMFVEIVAAMKEKFKGTEERGIYILELNDTSNKVIRRAPAL